MPQYHELHVLGPEKHPQTHPTSFGNTYDHFEEIDFLHPRIAFLGSNSEYSLRKCSNLVSFWFVLMQKINFFKK